MRKIGRRARALAVGAALVAVTTSGAVGMNGIASASGVGGVIASSGSTTSDPPDPALAQAVAKWVTGGGEADLTKLGTDFKSLEDAANASDLPQMSASCQQLQGDVQTAQKYAPIPDAAAQKNWASALALYARGAADCVSGADASNSQMLTKASHEITAGSAELDKVTARLAAIAG